MLGRSALRALTCVACLAATSSASSYPTGAGTLGLPEPLHALPGASGPYPPGTHLARDRPHPAVARIIVPEGNTAVSYGSGTLVDVRERFGLVVTNWHVVRDGTGEVEVVFPDGFRSKARPLKVNADWDLAALVIWRPPVEPVRLAATAPQPGDQLTICGYGSGQYRAATGRCTQYYAPAMNLPQDMVELDVEARQGDSGGPIFNARGELAGVLFGAGQGTTLGSFGGRVRTFLATLAPDIGRARDTAMAGVDQPAPEVESVVRAVAEKPRTPSAVITAPVVLEAKSAAEPAVVQAPAKREERIAIAQVPQAESLKIAELRPLSSGEPQTPPTAVTAAPVAPNGAFGYAKNALAVIGAVALVLQAVRLAR
ncbi:MAG TPA: serine protease [Lacipirellula sp.]